ncbi:processive 1,2-diacylglycerol beta-glucosyltransferase [Paenibacillaceae bacterium GAS479]|nr:processive 1,2-diacylglycerol beta-glucosyltransferase [Paenibacillaceae bacterium GAS479]
MKLLTRSIEQASSILPAPVSSPDGGSLELGRQPKLMILYASYGEGHLQAAKAIRDSLVQRGIHRTVLVDLMAEAHPLLNELTRKIYRTSYTILPGLYGWVYDRTRPMKPNTLFAAWLHSFGRSKLRRLLQQEQPDVLLHTFPIFAGPASRGLFRPPLTGAVVTDYDLHRRWVHPGIDRYYVATDDMQAEMKDAGIAPERICVTGIPVRQGFERCHQHNDREQLLRYGLDPALPLVLIMGGGSGIMNGITAACSLLLEQPDLQIALVCGHNEAFVRETRRHFHTHPAGDRLHVFGYLDSLHELMPLASCLVTKPGGLTLAEGLAAGVPLVLYRPMPGQERRNAEFLMQKDVAAVASTPAGLAEEILKLFADPERLRERSHRGMELGKADGAIRIADDLLQRLFGYTGKEYPFSPSPDQGGPVDELYPEALR